MTPHNPAQPAGANLLNAVEAFVKRFVSYPSEHALVAHVLWIAHTWFMDHWESTPRLAFLSPEPGSGKSRALEVTEPLVPRAIHSVNTTSAYLFRKVSDPAGPPTILYDEVDTIFGPKAKENEEVRGMLNAGHRRGATAGRAVKKGGVITTEELPSYCAVALAGLGGLPDTILTRSVVIRMRRRAPDETVEPWRQRLNAPEGQKLGELLAVWAETSADGIRWPDMPDGVNDRNADVWEALLAMADLAGGSWPDRGRRAAVALVGTISEDSGSLGTQLLRDLRSIFGEATVLPTAEILRRLNGLEDSPWGAFRGNAGITARELSKHLSGYGVKPTQYRDGELKLRGYYASDLADPWSRYLPPLPQSSDAGTTGTADPAPEPAVDSVPHVPVVPLLSEHADSQPCTNRRHSPRRRADNSWWCPDCDQEGALAPHSASA